MKRLAEAITALLELLEAEFRTLGRAIFALAGAVAAIFLAGRIALLGAERALDALAVLLEPYTGRAAALFISAGAATAAAVAVAYLARRMLAARPTETAKGESEQEGSDR